MTAPVLDEATRRSIDSFLARIAGRYDVAEAWLYGSRARGDARPDSDLDLAVVIDRPDRTRSSVAAEMGGDGFDVLTETGVFVSALPIWSEEWRDPALHSNPYLLAIIRCEGRLI